MNLYCESSLGSCQKLCMVSFVTSGICNNIRSARVYEPSRTTCVAACSFLLWAPLKARPFCVTQYVGWNSIAKDYALSKTQKVFSVIMLFCLWMNMWDTIICSLLWRRYAATSQIIRPLICLPNVLDHFFQNASFLLLTHLPLFTGSVRDIYSQYLGKFWHFSECPDSSGVFRIYYIRGQES